MTLIWGLNLCESQLSGFSKDVILIDYFICFCFCFSSNFCLFYSNWPILAIPLLRFSILMAKRESSSLRFRLKDLKRTKYCFAFNLKTWNEQNIVSHSIYRLKYSYNLILRSRLKDLIEQNIISLSIRRPGRTKRCFVFELF